MKVTFKMSVYRLKDDNGDEIRGNKTPLMIGEYFDDINSSDYQVGQNMALLRNCWIITGFDKKNLVVTLEKNVSDGYGLHCLKTDFGFLVDETQATGVFSSLK